MQFIRVTRRKKREKEREKTSGRISITRMRVQPERGEKKIEKFSNKKNKKKILELMRCIIIARNVDTSIPISNPDTQISFDLKAKKKKNK